MKNEDNTDLSKCNIATLPCFIIIIILRLSGKLLDLEENFKNKQTNGFNSDLLSKLVGITGLINVLD